jgi:hypothetical protein
MDKPPEDLLSEGLADIDQNVHVGSIVMAVVLYQEGSVQPEGANRHQLQGLIW